MRRRPSALSSPRDSWRYRRSAPGESLIAAIAREGNCDVFASLLREHPRRQRGRVGEGLAEVSHHRRERAQKVGFRTEYLMLGPKATCDLAGEASLVERGNVEAHRECFDGYACLSRR